MSMPGNGATAQGGHAASSLGYSASAGQPSVVAASHGLSPIGEDVGYDVDSPNYDATGFMTAEEPDFDNGRYMPLPQSQEGGRGGGDQWQ